MVRRGGAGVAAGLLTFALGAVVARPVRAQAAEGPTGGIAGVVYDSLVTNRPLAGAEVLVAGTTLATRTDNAGRFRIAGVPAGARRVTFFHPSLENLRFGAPTRTVQVPAGGDAEVQLLTPSPATVAAAFCPGAREVKTGALVGRVRDADTTRGVAGAAVEVGWNVFTVTDRGLVRRPRTVRTETLGDGGYFACGVPVDVPVRVSVRAPDGTAVVQEVALADRPLGVSYVDLPPAVAADTAALARAVAPGGALRGGPPPATFVAGVVRRADGRPFPGARVSVVGGAYPPATTGDDGRFVVPVAQAGRVAVEARAIGFRAVQVAVDAERGTPGRAALTLSDNVVVLSGVNVRAPRISAVLADFERRRQTGLGAFITANDIQARRPYSLADVFVLVPGVRVVLPDGARPGSSPRILFQRAAGTAGANANTCEPTVFVDGTRIASSPEVGLELDQVVPRPQDVYGVEVYRGIAAVPPPYQLLDSTCGVILIWTNRGR